MGDAAFGARSAGSALEHPSKAVKTTPKNRNAGEQRMSPMYTICSPLSIYFLLKVS